MFAAGPLAESEVLTDSFGPVRGDFFPSFSLFGTQVCDTAHWMLSFFISWGWREELRGERAGGPSLLLGMGGGGVCV